MSLEPKVVHPWHRCLTAVIAVTVAAAVRALFLGFLGPHLPFVTFFPALLFVTLFAGISAGLLAALLTVLYACAFLDHPFAKIFLVRGPADRIMLAVSATSGVLICVIALTRHNAQKRRAAAQALVELDEQRRLSEADLRESEARYRVLFENSLDAIFLTLPGGTISSANRAACELFRCSAQELCQCGLAGILDLALLPLPIGVQDGDHPGRAMRELSCLRKDGTRFPAEVGSVLLNDGQSCFTILRDITQRKRAEEELRRSEDKYRGIFENAPLGIFQSPPGSRYISVNPSTVRMFGYDGPQSVVQISKEDAGQLFPDLEQGISIFRRSLASGNYAHGEVDLYRKDGSRFIANLYLRAVPLAEGALLEGFVEDITERKQAEFALKRYARRLIALEENLRKRIAMELHDDIAQVVTALGLNLSFIGNNLQDDVQGVLRSKLEDSRQLTKEISRTVRHLMVDLRPVQLEEYGLVAAIGSHVEQFAQRSGIEAQVLAEPEFPRLSTKREIALFRIAQEALVNVAKHAAASKVIVALRSDVNGIELVITDDGRGFAPQVAPHLATEEGWGLSIMRERAELAGGTFSLRAAPGEGVSIRVGIGPDQD